MSVRLSPFITIYLFSILIAQTLKPPLFKRRTFLNSLFNILLILFCRVFIQHLKWIQQLDVWVDNNEHSGNKYWNLCSPRVPLTQKYSIKYSPGYVLASRLGITSYLVSRFSGSIFIGRGSKKKSVQLVFTL